MGKYLLVLGVLASLAGWVRADFVVMDPILEGARFYNVDALKDVSSFTGDVGAQASGVLVTVDAISNVDTGNGYSTIKPANSDDILTSLVFTPDDANLFDSFSFRGQLDSDAGGTVTLTVQDNQGGSPETFTFTGLGANADFARIGIIAVTGSGETIQSITLTSVFKEEKQNQFGYAPGGQPYPPIPVPPAVWSGLGLLGLLGVRRAVRGA